MTGRPSGRDILLGLVFPLSSAHALDPFAVKLYSKGAPPRLIWTLQSRLLQSIATLSHRPSRLPFGPGSRITLQDRGELLADTAVTSGQLEVLVQALKHVQKLNRDMVEIGAYRGATTVEFATRTNMCVYAVDPFIGYGGSDDDFMRFQARVKGYRNVIHIKQTSGSAAASFLKNSLSLVFLDAVHDVSNSWYDFCVWSEKVSVGGLIALHDVDDHPGARFAARRVIKCLQQYTVWGYCPNLLVLEKRAA